MDKRNTEQYPDLTAYEAIKNITRRERKARSQFRPVVYICSPYAGDTKVNTLNARRYSRFAYDMGAIPIAPHLLFPQFIDDIDPQERNTAMISFPMAFNQSCYGLRAKDPIVDAVNTAINNNLSSCPTPIYKKTRQART